MTWLEQEIERQYHPVAALFPLLEGPEFDELKADIAVNGLLESIWLHPDGTILDGRNRHRACIETNTRPAFRIWDNGGSLVSFVVSMNLHRRHLTYDQRVGIALRLEPAFAEEARGRQRGGQGGVLLSANSQKATHAAVEAAKQTDVGSRAVYEMKAIQNEEPDLADRLIAGDTTVREERRKEKTRKARDRTRPELGAYHDNGGKIVIGDARAMDLSQFEQYGVIVADPPWPYRIAKGQGTAEEQYNVLSEADLCAMPVPELALDNCALFLWGTWPKLPEVLQVMAAWGFEYVTGFPWVKTTTNGELSYGVGYWVRGASEFVLIGRRGEVSAPRMSGFMGLLSPNLQHSRKPDSVHVIAEAMDGPYLELFARRARPGWTVFGNEIEGVMM